MGDDERKKQVWTVKKGLFHLTADELFQLAMDIPPAPGQDSAKLDRHEEESCVDYICSYMDSAPLLVLEDQGMSQLSHLNDTIVEMISNCCQAETDVEGGADLVLPNADAAPHLPLNVVHTNTHATDTRTESETVDLASQAGSLESQLSKLISGYDSLCQKLKQGSSPLTPPPANTQLTVTECTQPRSQPILQSPHPSQLPEGLIAFKDVPLLQRK